MRGRRRREREPGVVNGLLVGAIAIVAALVVLVFFLRIRGRRQAREQAESQAQTERAQGAANLARATELPQVTSDHEDRMTLRFRRERHKDR